MSRERRPRWKIDRVSMMFKVRIPLRLLCDQRDPRSRLLPKRREVLVKVGVMEFEFILAGCSRRHRFVKKSRETSHRGVCTAAVVMMMGVDNGPCCYLTRTVSQREDRKRERG